MNFASVRRGGEAFSAIPHPKTACIIDLSGKRQNLLEHVVSEEDVINPAIKWIAGLMPGRYGREREAERFADMRRKARATNTVGISLPS
ncbi:MAG: hypothetical protein JJU31_08265 [Wenzhouxiangella sp.]|nr:hypothetical protein [Wenzhouxiangella sp.]TVR94117.1 MAG: hypothetical protein EA418_10905 [Wenzhouxiangellaceae bacterium]